MFLPVGVIIIWQVRHGDVWFLRRGKAGPAFDPFFDVTDGGEVFIELASVVRAEGGLQAARLVADKIEHAAPLDFPTGAVATGIVGEQVFEQVPGIGNGWQWRDGVAPRKAHVGTRIAVVAIARGAGLAGRQLK